MLNVTNIPAPRVPFIDERTGLMAREWYRFFLNLFVLTGSGNNPITLEELQLGPPNQPDLTELLIQINQNIAPQYEDQSGDFLATLDTAQLMSMMSRFENAESAIQGAYLQPVVQTGTIANYNLDGSPTAGGIAYGTGPALAVSAAGTVGQVLTSAGAGTPTWATPTTGTVSSVAALTLGTTGTDLSSTVANPTTTPVITLQVPTASASNRGALSAADWTTFNNKGSGTVTSVTGTAPVVSSGGTTPAISMAAATTSVNGYLTSTDWTTFNNKQPAGSYLVSGGALGTPSSGTVTNLTGTASININGTVGATTANTGRFTTISASGTITQTGAAATTTEGLLLDGTTTGAHYATISNTSGNLRLGIDNSAGTALITGGTAYGGIVGTNNARSLHLITNGTSRIAIDSAGAIVAPGAFAATGTITTSAAIYVNGSGTLYNLINLKDTVDQSGATYVQFLNSTGGGTGSITRVTTTNAVTYNTTSDYRLKNKQAPLIGSGAFIDALQPKTWEWTESGIKAAGFIAHEFAEVSPSSVSGEKDGIEEEEYEVLPAVDATFDGDGKELTPAVAAVKATRTVPLYQGMQASSSEVIANLVAEIQLLRKRVAALEAV